MARCVYVFVCVCVCVRVFLLACVLWHVRAWRAAARHVQPPTKQLDAAASTPARAAYALRPIAECRSPSRGVGTIGELVNV